MNGIYNIGTPDWAALERGISLAVEGNVEAPHWTEIIGDFMWMCEQPKGLHQYKHRDTRNYANLRIDSTPAECRAEIRKSMGWERTWGKDLDAQLGTANDAYAAHNRLAGGNV